MAHITRAIPVRLLGEKISDEEKLELENYGHKPLSESEMAQRQLDEIAHAERVAAKEADLAANGYKYRRAAKFKSLPIGDQLDALWKGMIAVIEGADMPEETAEMIEQIQAIKESEPKPEEV